jgi:alpha-galactosidase
MGWNAFYSLGCRVDERVAEQSADALIASGMARLGYRYVLLDDCWMARHRGAGGALRSHPGRFPHGIPALAEYVHSRGLKLGLYLSAGTGTCQGFAGSHGHLARDVQRVVGWGIDYLKVDWCYTRQTASPRLIYGRLSRAVAASNRPVVFSVSNWGWATPWRWAPPISNLWRISGDLAWAGGRRTWSYLMTGVETDARLARYARPGAWNDPDILPVGAPGLRPTEMRSAISLFSMLAAPLLAGNDVRSMSATTRSILSNPEVVAIDQDPGGVQGRRVSASHGREVWVRPLANGDRAVVLFNSRSRQTTIGADLSRLDRRRASGYQLLDVWSGARHTVARTIWARIARHGVAMFRVAPVRASAPPPQPAPPQPTPNVVQQLVGGLVAALGGR